MTLPSAFVTCMKEWLGPEWSLLKDALQEPPQRAARWQRWSSEPRPIAAEIGKRAPEAPYAIQHPGSPAPDSIQREFGDPVPWCADAFYIPLNSRLGKHLYHETGAYYIQEPSAMAVVSALQPQPGERILDLCAAPGGKSTAIGRAMRGQGLLVSNEIHPQRVTALAQNSERTGVPAAILNESPKRLASVFTQWFDAVLVDAPCSGEGMFRKDPQATAEWTPDSPQVCAERQRIILTDAVRMTRVGGRVVYSTCTFNPIENEQIVAWALANLPVERAFLPLWPSWETGRSDWANGVDMSHTRRFWPHRGRGEGHFVAAFRVLDPAAAQSSMHAATPRSDAKAPHSDWRSWLADMVQGETPPAWLHPTVRGNILWADPFHLLSLPLKCLRPGIPLASTDHGRFTPHHAWAMAIDPPLFRRQRAVSTAEALDYLSGASLPDEDARGYVLLTVAGLPLGFAKGVPGRLNNLYPKGLRKNGLLGE